MEYAGAAKDNWPGALTVLMIVNTALVGWISVEPVTSANCTITVWLVSGMPLLLIGMSTTILVTPGAKVTKVFVGV